MKTKFLLLILFASSVVISCSDRDSDDEIIYSENISKIEDKKDTNNNSSVPTQRTGNDTVQVSNIMKEISIDLELSDGGDPKDIPPRR